MALLRSAAATSLWTRRIVIRSEALPYQPEGLDSAGLVSHGLKGEALVEHGARNASARTGSRFVLETCHHGVEGNESLIEAALLTEIDGIVDGVDRPTDGRVIPGHDVRFAARSVGSKASRELELLLC